MKKFVLCMMLGLFLGTVPMSAYKVIVKIPKTAVMVDQNDSLELYINKDHPAKGGDPAVISVYIKYKDTGKARYVLTSNPLAETLWTQMGAEQKAPITAFDVMAIDKACFLPGTSLIYLEGCPDARNVCSYIYDYKKKSGCQLQTSEGLLTIEPEKKLLHLSAYRYHPEGGRYSVEKIFTYDGDFVEERPIGEE